MIHNGIVPFYTNILAVHSISEIFLVPEKQVYKNGLLKLLYLRRTAMTRPIIINLVFIVALILALAADSANSKLCPADLLEWDAGLYPSMQSVLFTGGEPCFVGKMCSWYLRLSELNSTVDLSISVNFNPPLFYFLSTNQYSMKGSEHLAIDIPAPKEGLIGIYTFTLELTAQNFSYRGCNEFEIRNAPVYNPNITRYIPTDNSTVFKLLDTFWTTTNSLNFALSCDTPFSFGTNNDFSRFDVIKTYVANTWLNITTLNCLNGIASRYHDGVLNGEYQQIPIGDRLDLFWTDGYQVYQKLYNQSFDFIPLIDIWIPVFPNPKEGGICTAGALYAHTRYVDALINRMARSGVLEPRLPRAINYLMNSMLPATYGVFTATTNFYGNGLIEAGYAMRTLVTWGLLTGDTRVPYVLHELSEFCKIWILPDFQVRDSLNLTTYNAESSAGLGMAYAAYWRYSGDQAHYDLALNLLNASLVIGSQYASVSSKQAEYFVNRNFDTLMWLLDPSVPLVSSKIPFVFPDIVIPSNNTVVLPNQTIVFTETTLLQGNFEVSDGGSVELTYGNVLNITGCAKFSGTLVLIVKDGQLVLNDTLLAAYACRDGEFDEFVLQGTVDPCLVYGLRYTPTTLSIVVSSNTCATTSPKGSDQNFPDWAIAVIVVVGGLGICGAIIGIVLHYKKTQAKKARGELDRKIEMAAKP